MAAIDRAFVDDMLERLGRLTPESRPLWGTMNMAQLFGHLRIVTLHTMGEGGINMPFKGNFVSRNVFRHLIVNQLVAIPKNIRLPRPKGMKEMPPPPEATLEELQSTLRDYLARCDSGQLPDGVMHPFFGPLTAREWRKFHVAHFTHHMKQFGV